MNELNDVKSPLHTISIYLNVEIARGTAELQLFLSNQLNCGVQEIELLRVIQTQSTLVRVVVCGKVSMYVCLDHE